MQKHITSYGIPVRKLSGDTTELVEENLKEVRDAHVDIFKLGRSDAFEDDKIKYEKILDEAAKEIVDLIDEVSHFVNNPPEEPYFLVMLRYHRIFAEPIKKGNINNEP